MLKSKYLDLKGIQRTFALCTCLLIVFVSCKEDKKTESKEYKFSADVSSKTGSSNSVHNITAEPAPEWSEILIQKSGWIGADGIYSIPLDGVENGGRNQDTETLLIFSDSIIGNIKNGKLGEDDWSMVHNTIAYLKKSKSDIPEIEFYYKKDENGRPVSVFDPQTPNAESDDIYWLGDGFVNTSMDNRIYIFAYRVQSLDEGIYPFRIAGVSLIMLPAESRPPYEDQEQVETPLFRPSGNGNITFGSSILVNTEEAGAANPDGYVYVYGVKGANKELVVSRVKPENFEDFDMWKFWDGQDWVTNIESTKGLIPQISNEMSVSGLKDGKFLATYQLDTNSPDIVVQVANSPVGPFHPYKKVWKTPEIYEDLDFYTYNAKAHPHLSKPGELLITYNVNSFDFLQDIAQHPNHLRPRFIRLRYEN